MIAGTAGAQPVCGNGVLEPPEQCDDGNLLPDDCCAPDCTITNLPPVCTDAFPTHRPALAAEPQDGLRRHRGRRPTRTAIRSRRRDGDRAGRATDATCPDGVGSASTS
jgi:cysteine-rich repeat protein